MSSKLRLHKALSEWSLLYASFVHMIFPPLVGFSHVSRQVFLVCYTKERFCNLQGDAPPTC